MSAADLNAFTPVQLDEQIASASHELTSWLARAIPLAEADASQHSNQLRIGDWIDQGQERFGKRKAYDEAIKLFPRYEREVLREFAHVARNVPELVRTNVLSFRHHRLVARFKNPEYQKELLDHAVITGLKSKAFSKYLDEKHPQAPKATKPQTRTARIDAEQSAAIEFLAETHNVPFDEIVRTLIARALDMQIADLASQVERVQELAHV